MEKRTKGVYVPIGGRKLITFMDDFNMPAKDTFGSQPPLELMRQWLDYGLWYDRSRQTIKKIQVCTSIVFFFHVRYNCASVASDGVHCLITNKLLFISVKNSL